MRHEIRLRRTTAASADLGRRKRQSSTSSAGSKHRAKARKGPHATCLLSMRYMREWLMRYRRNRVSLLICNGIVGVSRESGQMPCTNCFAQIIFLRLGEHSAGANHDADEADNGRDIGAGGKHSGADTSGP